MGRSPVKMKLDDSSMELIRCQTLEKAATDLRRAADAMDDLSHVKRPVPARDVEDTRANVALVRTWLAVVDQVGWPIAKELLFTARIVEAEEAYRIGLLNHLVPRAQLRAKTMEIAKMIAKNHRGAVMGIKALMLKQMTQNLEDQFSAEKDYTTHVLRGAKAKDAFPEFMKRKGLSAN